MKQRSAEHSKALGLNSSIVIQGAKASAFESRKHPKNENNHEPGIQCPEVFGLLAPKLVKQREASFDDHCQTMWDVAVLTVLALVAELAERESRMRSSANNVRALLATGALLEPTGAICAETIFVTPHIPCNPVAPIRIAKPSIDRPEITPIPVARAEIASVEVAGKEKAGADASQSESVAAPPQVLISLPCPSPSPIGVRYVPDIRKEKEAEYERKRPRDPNVVISEAGRLQGRDPD
jgi:hypothetical protein